MNNELKSITKDIKNTLLFLSESGVKGFDCSQKSIEIINLWGQNKAESKKNFQPSLPDKIAVPQQKQRVETLETIRNDLGNCQRCKLCARRKNLVFGAGNPNARLVFVGEAPGYEEDIQGQPFVGASGQLLTKMINAMGLGRDDIYICNLLKCRPDGNRNPLPEEILACQPFLKRQLELIKPEVICTLGGFASQNLLGVNTGITKLRGRFHSYNGIKLMPIFHPAYLLRNPAGKRAAWEDLQKIMMVLGLKRKI